MNQTAYAYVWAFKGNIPDAQHEALSSGHTFPDRHWIEAEIEYQLMKG